MAIARIPHTIINTLTKIDQPTAFFAMSEILGSLIAPLPRAAVSPGAARHPYITTRRAAAEMLSPAQPIRRDRLVLASSFEFVNRPTGRFILRSSGAG